MRELRSCDFCGADPVGVFEVLPPALTPADDQRRVALCADCRETMEYVLEPLLRRLDADASVDVPEDASAETGATATTQSVSDGSDGDVSTVDVDAVEPEPEPEPAPPYPADHETPDDPLGDDAADNAADEPDDRSGADAPDDDSDGVGGADDDSGADDDGDSADVSDDRREEPPKFRKVIRILQNREFPVDRAEVETLAAGAYDLDDDEVREIFDYAVHRGLLEDDGGTLRKP